MHPARDEGPARRTACASATAAGWRASPRAWQQQIQDAVALTCNNQRITLNVAFNYGGRAEIVDAVRHIMRDGHSPEEVTEELISQYLYTGGLPDPDLIIRTGGE